MFCFFASHVRAQSVEFNMKIDRKPKLLWVNNRIRFVLQISHRREKPYVYSLACEQESILLAQNIIIQISWIFLYNSILSVFLKIIWYLLDFLEINYFTLPNQLYFFHGPVFIKPLELLDYFYKVELKAL